MTVDWGGWKANYRGLEMVVRQQPAGATAAEDRLSLEQWGLGATLFRIPKIAQTYSYEAIALLGTKAHPLP